MARFLECKCGANPTRHIQIDEQNSFCPLEGLKTNKISDLYQDDCCDETTSQNNHNE